MTSGIPFAALLALFTGDSDRFLPCLDGVLAARRGSVLAAGRHHLHPVSQAVYGPPGVGVSHRRPALYPAEARSDDAPYRVICLLRRVIASVPLRTSCPNADEGYLQIWMFQLDAYSPWGARMGERLDQFWYWCLGHRWVQRTVHDTQAAHEFVVCMRCGKVSGAVPWETGPLRTGRRSRTCAPSARCDACDSHAMPQHDGLLDAAVAAQQRREAADAQERASERRQDAAGRRKALANIRPAP